MPVKNKAQRARTSPHKHRLSLSLVRAVKNFNTGKHQLEHAIVGYMAQALNPLNTLSFHECACFPNFPV